MAAVEGTIKGIFFYFQLVVPSESLYTEWIIKKRSLSRDLGEENSSKRR